MQASSLDLRQRVVRAYEHGQGSLAEIAEQFFEARRVARSLYEAEVKPPEPPGRRGRLRRKFWYWASLFFNR